MDGNSPNFRRVTSKRTAFVEKEEIGALDT
jgi:hypothetical protein